VCATGESRATPVDEAAKTVTRGSRCRFFCSEANVFGTRHAVASLQRISRAEFYMYAPDAGLQSGRNFKESQTNQADGGLIPRRQLQHRSIHHLEQLSVRFFPFGEVRRQRAHERISVFIFGPGTFLVEPTLQPLFPTLGKPKTSGSAYFGESRGNGTRRLSHV
jgi:hypothetical protein